MKTTRCSLGLVGIPVLVAASAHAGLTTRLSLGPTGGQGNADSRALDDASSTGLGPNRINISLSADGRYAAFASLASNLVPGDTNHFVDVFVRDRATGTMSRESVPSVGSGIGESNHPSLSADGRLLVFTSSATDLVPSDANSGDFDVFVRDRDAGTTVLASVASDGTQGNDSSGRGVTSGDGRVVAFVSRSAKRRSVSQTSASHRGSRSRAR